MDLAAKQAATLRSYNGADEEQPRDRPPGRLMVHLVL